MTRALVLCADDYALTPGISRALIDLAERGRISALSCMTGSPFWPEHAAWLKPLVGRIDVGLHVTLVDEAPLTPMPHLAPAGHLPGIGSLILRSYARTLDMGEIEREIAAQFEAFENLMGRPPDHVDGHLHTHVLPDIRKAVRTLMQNRAPQAWLRNVAEPMGRIMRRRVAVPKTMLISALGRGLRAAQPMNDGFGGVYGLVGTENIAHLFARFLDTDAARPLILCHPGDCAGEDVACRTARINEYEFLKSQAFADLLQRFGFALGRGSQVYRAA